MTLRLFVDTPLAPGALLALPEHAARHVQVLRLQPGDDVRLFNALGCGEGTGPEPATESADEWPARILTIGRKTVEVEVGAPQPVQREPGCRVLLAIGMPANERMDALVEKAVELGAAALQPLHCERSVLRLSGERAQRRREHWQGVAIAACEQSGRACVPRIEPVTSLAQWLADLAADMPSERAAAGAGFPSRWLLSLDAHATALAAMWPAAVAAMPRRITVLSGPEGGLDADEQAAALAAGFTPVSLGPRVLRADTAPLAALAWIAALG